jgi:hypothetical protein
MHIQQVKLETDEGDIQSEEQLEGVGHIPTEEMARVKLSWEEAEKWISQEETAEMKSVVEWTLSATDDEGDMGDHCDLPICRKLL